MPNNHDKRRRGGKRFPRGCSPDEGKVDSQQKACSDSPLCLMFRQFQTELDEIHDKHERLVKVSRDITIESKRTIFLLHRIDSDESKVRIVTEVQKKLEDLRKTKWHQVAVELQNEDPYQFLRAYSPGLQEYIEAVAFLYYMEHGSLLSLKQVASSLTFAESCSDVALEPVNQCTGEIHDSEEELDVTNTSAGAARFLSVHVPPVEYMLGLADLTGELMRMAIGCIGRGEFQAPFELCKFIQSMHNAFLSFGNQSRELSSKFAVLRQSMRKVEDACYALQVRGSEMPKHLLADVLSSMAVRTSSYETNADTCPDYVE